MKVAEVGQLVKQKWQPAHACEFGATGYQRRTGQRTGILAAKRSACASLAVAAAAARRGRPWAHGRGFVVRRADIGGGVDFAVIRFKVPGLEDLTNLPRALSLLGITLLIANRFYFPNSGVAEGARTITEATAILLALACATLPWVGERLQEAARRQVSTRPDSRAPGSLQTFALEEDLSLQARLDLSWASATLLRLTNADGLAVYLNGAVVCTRGLLQQLPGFSDGSARVLQELGKAWQLPAGAVDGYCATRSGLAAFPAGALPTAVLPGDVEAAVVKPIAGGGLLVAWSALPRAFDREADREWIARMAAKIGGRAAELGPERSFEVAPPLLSTEQFEDTQTRIAPAVLGLLAIALLGWNRSTLLGIVTTDIPPAQARADLLCGILAITLVLQGMVWLSETPAPPEVDDTSTWEDAQDVLEAAGGLPEAVVGELRWAWNALSSCTRVCSMAVVWGDECVMRGGLFQPDAKVTVGDFCKEVMRTGRGRYLPQLKLYPAREQFLPFLPKRTQGLVLTPLRPGRDASARGVLILGVHTIRGVGKVDQAWIGALAEKLAVALEEC